MKEGQSKILSCILILILLTLNITKVIYFTETLKFNIALSDIFVPLIIFTSLFFLNKSSIKQMFKYSIFWFCLISWIILTSVLALISDSVFDSGLIGIFKELIKTGICIIYFIIGYNTLRILKKETFKLTWSISILLFIVGGFAIYILTINGIYFWSDDPNYINYFMGTDTDPNHAATFLTVSFFGMGIFSLYTKNFLKKVYLFFIMGMTTIGLIFTGSRGGLFGFIIGILILIFYYSYKNWKAALSLILIIFMLLIIFLNIDQYFWDGTFAQRLLYKLINIESGFDVRANLSTVALQMGFDHPIFGVGRGNFRLNSYQYFKDFKFEFTNDIPHNTYFGIFAETGVVGLILFLTPFILIVYSTIKRYKRRSILFKNELIVIIWICAGLFALSLQASVLNIENRRFLWYLSGVIIYFIEYNIIVLENDVMRKKDYRYVHISLLIMLVLTTLHTINSVHFPYYIHVVKQNYVYEIPKDDFCVGRQYVVGVKLSVVPNKENCERVILKIVEIGEDGTTKVLDSYSYLGSNGIVLRKFTPTMNKSRIQLKAHKLDQSLNNFAVLPIFVHDGSKVVNLNNWFYLQPKFLLSYTLDKNKLDFDDWVQKTNLSNGLNKTFDNKLKVESISIEQNNDESTEITLKVSVIGKIEHMLIPWMYGYPNDLHLLEEVDMAIGVESYEVLNSEDYLSWKVGQTHNIVYKLPRQKGIYNLMTGFYYMVDNKIVHLSVDGNAKLKYEKIQLNLGWLNLDEGIEGIHYE